MYFCPITPADCAERYGAVTRHHLILAQWACRSRCYTEYARRAAARGDVVILDNGAYEGELVTNEELLELYKELEGSHVYVTLRDGVGRAEETREMSEHSLEYFYSRRLVPKFMVVVQGKKRDWDDWLMMYYWASKLKPNYIAFPRFLDRERTYYVELLQKCGLWRPDVRHHAFGMVNGDLGELPVLAELGVYSIDSSAPTWRGMHGYDFNNWYSWKRVPEDVATDTSQLNHEMAHANLERVVRLCRSR